jgi:hypothetical protein
VALDRTQRHTYGAPIHYIDGGRAMGQGCTADPLGDLVEQNEDLHRMVIEQQVILATNCSHLARVRSVLSDTYSCRTDIQVGAR